MRTTVSLSDITSTVCNVVPSSILSSLPTVAGGTRLAVFYSSAAVFNSQLSAANRQIRLLEAENAALKDSVKSLSGRNSALVVEVDALRAQARDLAARNAQLENEKKTLVDDVRIERVQGVARIKKARELETSLKQRDAFVHAMIDINLHQNVLKDAYSAVQTGTTADEALISAIISAASYLDSPWSRILAPPDVTKSDVYKCAIELAATARLRTDKSVQVAKFWRHVAKCDPRNSDIATPSSSTLEHMNSDLKREERGRMLDDLLIRLRAGEDIRNNNDEERKHAFFSRPETPQKVLKSPSSLFHEFYCPGTQQAGTVDRSDSSLETTISWDSNFMAPAVTNPEHPKEATPPLRVPSNSLQRICEAFNVSSTTSLSSDDSIFGDSQLPSIDRSLQPVNSLATGRGRSATVPFSARDLTFLAVKNVISKVPVVTAPGGKEQEAQALTGQKVRFNKQKLLVRSKATKSRRPRTIFSENAKSTPADPTPVDFKPTEMLSQNSNRTHIKAGLPTPPTDSDSIRYVRPPTVTCKKGSSPLFFDMSAISLPSTIPTRPSLDSIPSSPSQQKIRRYVVKDPSLPRPKPNISTPPCSDPPVVTVVRPPSGESCSSESSQRKKSNQPSTLTPPKRVFRSIANQIKSAAAFESNKPSSDHKRRASIPVTPTRTSANKENVPPIPQPLISVTSTRISVRSPKENGLPGPQPSTLTTPARSSPPSPSKIPARSPPSSAVHNRRSSTQTSVKSITPPRLPALKKVIPILKPVQPLRIVKKNLTKKPPAPVAKEVPSSSPTRLRPQRGSPTSSKIPVIGLTR